MSERQILNSYNASEANEFLRNVLLIALGVLISFLFVRNTLPQTKSSNKFDELLNIIQNYYVDTINIQNTEGKAVSTLLNSLDPHSIYISKEDIDAANEPLSGSFSGIGVEFYIVRDTIVVVSPISGGPSELAGIKSGDKIVKINDTGVAGTKISNADVFKKLRGVKGSTVKLSIERNNKLLPAFIIKRDDIVVKSVEKGIFIDSITGFIKINSFGEKTYDEFYDQLAYLKEKNIQNLIIDLRQNTGGFLEIAVQILDELIGGKELLVYTKGMKMQREDFYSGQRGLFENGKVAVLLDEGSASASEILAGAIQDLDRGAIIGRRSFGKGLVQNQIPLSDGSAVRLTVARYYTPSGRNIQKPYKSTDDYEEEVYNRYKNGEFFEETKQTTNDTVSYMTKGGRKVRGGGGIYPDYFVSLDTNYDYISLSALRSAVPDYVYSNFSRFSTDISQYRTLDEFIKKYNVTDKVLGDFYLYAENNGVKWNKNNKSNFEAKLKNNLKAFIAKQSYQNEGFQKVVNSSDPMISKSLQYFHSNK